ncbi:MAG TPA: hypothetical protein VEC14_07410 [Reyranellaceae bacterium]|nr:hypothetical protein [Reyranellaceae bacterium]
MKAIATAAALLAAAFLGGCATVTMGTTQEITIDAEPQGAECKVDRRGVNQTTVRAPSVASVPRSGDTLVVTCSADGFQPETQHVAPTFSGATIGNVLIGGIIGVAIDAASGANNAYPSRVSMFLMPLAFDSEQSRDVHFAGAAARIRERSEEQVKLRRSHCGATQKELCDLNVKEIEAGRDQMLVQLETKRQLAQISPGGTRVAAALPQRLPPADPARLEPTVPSTPAGYTQTASGLSPNARAELTPAPKPASPPPAAVAANDRPLSAEEGRTERERRILAEEKRLMEERQRIVDAEKRVLDEERRAAEEKRQATERERRAAEAARVAALTPPTATSSPYATAAPPARTVAVQRTALPPGTDGSWRGTYTCEANSFAVPVALEVDMRLQGGKGRAVYATQGAQTHSLALSIEGGKAIFKRVSENANGRQIEGTLVGPASNEAIQFTATEAMINSGHGIGAGTLIYYHCTVSLTRGL